MMLQNLQEISSVIQELSSSCQTKSNGVLLSKKGIHKL